MKLEEYILVIEDFLKDYLKKAHSSKYVIGLSGGVDSSLVLALAVNAVGKENVLAYIIPIESQKADSDDAVEIAKHFGVNYKIVNLDKTYHQALKDYDLENLNPLGLTLTNLKVRLRMVTLYTYAQANNALVLGTDNWAEHYVGYFTKYGDGAADVNPIIHLTKGEVVKAALILGVPRHLAERKPSAGLFPGQEDEIEMGIRYSDLDAHLLGQKIDIEALNKIEALHRRNLHKLIDIPSPEEFKRS